MDNYVFVGRKTELESLEAAYRKDRFSFNVIYGRRRVGKTAMINEFSKNKKTIYFVAVQSNIKENLEVLSEQILQTLAPGAPKNPFASIREALEYVFQTAQNEKIVFAIDEYPYLAESERSVSSILQALIDKYNSKSRLFLILCGSSMSFMENQVLGYESPLYGRRTAQYKIMPFDYHTCAKLLPQFNAEDKITLYGITGGVPEYLSGIDNGLSVFDNAKALFFTPSGRLFEEPSNLLKQELKIPATYNAILTAIAGGRSKLNEIAGGVGIETSQGAKMLNTLISLGICKKEVPIIEKESGKKTLYRLEDQMFIFWYRFVFPQLSRINMGLGSTVCGEVFSEQLYSHVGYSFENCAIQYMWRKLLQNKLAFSFDQIGRWWGNNPVIKREEEIDFIAIGKDGAIFGECKWKNHEMGVEILEDLIRKSEIFPQFKNRHYALFSKSGFTAPLKKTAKKKGNIILVEPEMMFD